MTEKQERNLWYIVRFFKNTQRTIQLHKQSGLVKYKRKTLKNGKEQEQSLEKNKPDTQHKTLKELITP